MSTRAVCRTGLGDCATALVPRLPPLGSCGEAARSRRRPRWPRPQPRERCPEPAALVAQQREELHAYVRSCRERMRGPSHEDVPGLDARGSDRECPVDDARPADGACVDPLAVAELQLGSFSAGDLRREALTVV